MIRNPVIIFSFSFPRFPYLFLYLISTLCSLFSSYSTLFSVYCLFSFFYSFLPPPLPLPFPISHSTFFFRLPYFYFPFAILFTLFSYPFPHSSFPFHFSISSFRKCLVKILLSRISVCQSFIHIPYTESFLLLRCSLLLYSFLYSVRFSISPFPAFLTPLPFRFRLP